MGCVRGTLLGALIVATSTLLVLQLVNVLDLRPSASAVVLLGILALLVLALGYPRQVERLGERLRNVKFAGVEVGLAQVERAGVAERLPRQEEDFGKIPLPEMKRTGTVLGDLNEIRACLVERLEWLGKEFELHRPEPDEILRDLASRNLVDNDQHGFARDLLAPAGSDLPSLPYPIAEQYLDRAWRFTHRLRRSVFDRAVRRDLAEANWFVADFKQTLGHRPDFLVFAHEQWLLVAARVALDPDSASSRDTGQIAKTRARWVSQRQSEVTIQLSGRLIVIPGNSDAPESHRDPYVVKRPRLGCFLRTVVDPNLRNLETGRGASDLRTGG